MREGNASLAEGWGSTAAARAASPRDAASTVRPSRGAAKVELFGKTSGDATPARTSPFGTEGADGSLQRTVIPHVSRLATLRRCEHIESHAAVPFGWTQVAAPETPAVSTARGGHASGSGGITLRRDDTRCCCHDSPSPGLERRCGKTRMRRPRRSFGNGARPERVAAGRGLREASRGQRSKTWKPRRATGPPPPATVGQATDSPAEQGLEVEPPSKVVNGKGAGKCGDARPAAGGGEGSGGRSIGGKALECRAATRATGGGNPMNPMVGSGMQQAHDPSGGETRQGGERPRRRNASRSWHCATEANPGSWEWTPDGMSTEGRSLKNPVEGARFIRPGGTRCVSERRST